MKLSRSATLRALALWLAPAVLSGCAPLSRSVVPVDGASPEDIAAVSMLTVDSQHPLLLRGVDERPLPVVRVPSALRTWSFAVSPGRHTLWISTVPYGHPLIPQFIRCYVMDVSLEPGSSYVLRYEPARELALLLRPDDSEPRATGQLVDRPLMLARDCRWQ